MWVDGLVVVNDDDMEKKNYIVAPGVPKVQTNKCGRGKIVPSFNTLFGLVVGSLVV